MTRVGGYNGKSATQLQSGIENNTEDISTLAKNIDINSANIETLNGLIGALQVEVDTLEQTQNNDHQSIVANGSSIEEIKTEIVTINDSISTIETDITSINNKINNLPFTNVGTLPTGASYANKIVYYTTVAGLCYSLNGTVWYKVSDNTVVT